MNLTEALATYHKAIRAAQSAEGAAAREALAYLRALDASSAAGPAEERLRAAVEEVDAAHAERQRAGLDLDAVLEGLAAPPAGWPAASAARNGSEPLGGTPNWASTEGIRPAGS